MPELTERRAEQALWDAGYVVQPGMGTDMLVLDSNRTKVAFASRRLSDGRWTARKLGGCMAFVTPQVVADSPCIGFVQVLGITVVQETESPAPAAVDDDTEDRESRAADRLSELGYLIAPFARPGMQDAIALVKDGEGIAFAEPMPNGRWRAKKKGMARAMLGDANAVYDTGPMTALCRLIGKPV